MKLKKLIPVLLLWALLPFGTFANNNIVGFSQSAQAPNALTQNIEPKVVLVVKDGSIKVTHSGIMGITIYNIHGAVVFDLPESSGSCNYRPSKPGIYLVKANNKTYKVVVKQ